MIFTQKVWDAFLNENNNPSFVKMANAVIEQLGGVVVGCAFLIELEELNGRKTLENYEVLSLMKY